MQKGQVLAVVLLILGLVATVGLSLASRSVTEVRVSTTQEESARALEAAEIGLERYLGELIEPTPGVKTDLPDIDAGYYIPSVGTIGKESFYKVPFPLVEGDVATVDTPTCTGGLGNTCPKIDICWAKDDPPAERKIEISFFYVMGDGPNAGRVGIRRIGFDPENVLPGFTDDSIVEGATCDTTDTTYDYGVTLKLNSDNKGVDLNLGTNSLLFIRVRMLGNGSIAEPVALAFGVGNAIFPQQGGEVIAVGEAGESVQKVKAKVLLWDLPPMFDGPIFAGGNLIK